VRWVNDGPRCSYSAIGMRELLQKERVQWTVMFALLITSIIILIIFFEWLALPYSTLWRFMLYSTLIILCIPLFIETFLHRKLKSEHDKIITDLKRIEQELRDCRSRPVVVSASGLFRPAIKKAARKKPAYIRSKKACRRRKRPTK